MQESTEAFIRAENDGQKWQRRSPRHEGDRLLGRTNNWLHALPKGVRPVQLHVQFPRIANEIARMWGQTEAVDDYFQEKEFSPRDDRKGFPALIKEELLALHLYSLRTRAPNHVATLPRLKSMPSRAGSTHG